MSAGSDSFFIIRVISFLQSSLRHFAVSLKIGEDSMASFLYLLQQKCSFIAGGSGKIWGAAFATKGEWDGKIRQISFTYCQDYAPRDKILQKWKWHIEGTGECECFRTWQMQAVLTRTVSPSMKRGDSAKAAALSTPSSSSPTHGRGGAETETRGPAAEAR